MSDKAELLSRARAMILALRERTVTGPLHCLPESVTELLIDLDEGIREMSKGCDRRPCLVPRRQFEARWERVFRLGWWMRVRLWWARIVHG